MGRSRRPNLSDSDTHVRLSSKLGCNTKFVPSENRTCALTFAVLLRMRIQNELFEGNCKYSIKAYGRSLESCRDYEVTLDPWRGSP